jgi:hypothetical protein
MTLHFHLVDSQDSMKARTGGQKENEKEVPRGWEIAPGDAYDLRVCREHRWQCPQGLVFENGDCFFTAGFYYFPGKRCGQNYLTRRGEHWEQPKVFVPTEGSDALLRMRA